MSIRIQCPHCNGTIELAADANKQVVATAISAEAVPDSASEDLLDLLGAGDDKEKVVKPAKTTALAQGDPALVASLEAKPAAPEPSGKVEQLAPLSATGDAAAAGKLIDDKLPKRPRLFGADKAAAAEFPPMPAQLNLCSDLFPLLNEIAREAKSIWAATDPEVKKGAEVFDRLIEKYLPSIGPYSLEATAIGLAVAYLVPRFLELKAARRTAADSPKAAAAAGHAAATDAALPDDRLVKLRSPGP
jgi:hypothetical protein